MRKFCSEDKIISSFYSGLRLLTTHLHEILYFFLYIRKILTCIAILNIFVRADFSYANNFEKQQLPAFDETPPVRKYIMILRTHKCPHPYKRKATVCFSVLDKNTLNLVLTPSIPSLPPFITLDFPLFLPLFSFDFLNSSCYYIYVLIIDNKKRNGEITLSIYLKGFFLYTVLFRRYYYGIVT